MNAETFNSLHKVGTPVFAYPGIRPEHPVAVAFQKRANDGRSFGDKNPCKRLVTRTRTPAWELGHGEPVVSVDGYAGGIVLDHVDVVSESVWQAAKEAEAVAEAVADQGALPVPAGPKALDDANLRAENERLRRDLDRAREDIAFLERATLPELRRDVEHHKAGKQRWRDRAERAEARLSAVLDICDREQRNAMRWENPIPVPEWVAPVQRAALGDDKQAEAAS